jgi:hypothetical protein
MEIVRDEIEDLITDAAAVAQAEYAKGGEYYQLGDLKTVYRKWYEDSIKVLLEECAPVIAERKAHVFNQYAFNNYLKEIECFEPEVFNQDYQDDFGWAA